MWEAYTSALATLFQPINLLVLFVAVVIGLVIGVIPGLGGLVAVLLLLPLVFRLPTEPILILLVALHAVIYTGAVLRPFNIPGTAPNIATSLDGFPMTQRGEGGRAIGAAVTSSLFGGALPVLWSLLMIPLIMPIILLFGQPEMAAIILLGISFLVALSSWLPYNNRGRSL